MKSWNHEIMKSWNHEIMKSWNHEIMKKDDSKTKRTKATKPKSAKDQVKGRACPWSSSFLGNRRWISFETLRAGWNPYSFLNCRTKSFQRHSWGSIHLNRDDVFRGKKPVLSKKKLSHEICRRAAIWRETRVFIASAKHDGEFDFFAVVQGNCHILDRSIGIWPQIAAFEMHLQCGTDDRQNSFGISILMLLYRSRVIANVTWKSTGQSSAEMK
jgi:hypothetical protein